MERQQLLHHSADPGSRRPFLRAADGETGGSHGAATGSRGAAKSKAVFAPVRRCVGLYREQREQTPARPIRADLGRLLRADEGRKSKRDKEQASSATPCSVTSARSAGSFGVFWEFQSGVKIEGELSLLRSLSLKAYIHKKKVGVMPRKGAHFEQERKICPLSHP